MSAKTNSYLFPEKYVSLQYERQRLHTTGVFSMLYYETIHPDTLELLKKDILCR